MIIAGPDEVTRQYHLRRAVKIVVGISVVLLVILFALLLVFLVSQVT